jgi:hypothetical protein
VKINWRIGGTRRFHLQDWRVNQAREQHKTSSKLVLPFSPEDGGDIFLRNYCWLSSTAGRYIPDNRYLQNQNWENLSSYRVFINHSYIWYHHHPNKFQSGTGGPSWTALSRLQPSLSPYSLSPYFLPTTIGPVTRSLLACILYKKTIVAKCKAKDYYAMLSHVRLTLPPWQWSQ